MRCSRAIKRRGKSYARWTEGESRFGSKQTRSFINLALAPQLQQLHRRRCVFLRLSLASDVKGDGKADSPDEEIVWPSLKLPRLCEHV
jgi:hypothetical protein